MVKLTKRIVDDATPRETAYFIWCSELSGFGVRVHPTGKRAYYVDYRTKQGQRKRLAIGPHGKLTTEEGRRLALGILGGVIRGEDPARERSKAMTALLKLHGGIRTRGSFSESVVNQKSLPLLGKIERVFSAISSHCLVQNEFVN